MPGTSIAAWRIERQDDAALLRLSGDWLVGGSGLRAVADLQRIFAEIGTCASLRFDTSGVTRWDSALVAFVRALQTTADGRRRFELDLAGLPEPAQRLLSLAAADHGSPAAVEAPAQYSIAWRAGTRALAWWAELVASAELLGISVLSIAPALRGRLLARSSDVIALMRESGGGALGIIAVVNGLVGAILAFVGAVQLQRFGATIYVANLVGVAVIREMAAIMTAIVMAGRTGGAYAAQIATMEGNEEIDALRALGISPYHYLVVPRVTALVAMMPVMYFYACLVGLAGGLLVSVAMLDMSPTVFLGQLRGAVLPTEFYIGLSKSICFGAFIALAGCRMGLSAGRSAADVGLAATGAVVAGIIGVIALDAVFAACANVLGI
jgi:phospholipid/cholesterol/gamma-HCH transport system permease protein